MTNSIDFMNGFIAKIKSMAFEDLLKSDEEFICELVDKISTIRKETCDFERGDYMKEYYVSVKYGCIITAASEKDAKMKALDELSKGTESLEYAEIISVDCTHQCKSCTDFRCLNRDEVLTI